MHKEMKNDGVYFVAVTIVLAVTVYQLIVNDKLPTTSNTPIISQLIFFETKQSSFSTMSYKIASHICLIDRLMSHFSVKW